LSCYAKNLKCLKGPTGPTGASGSVAFDLLHVCPADTNDYLTYTSINPNGISGTVTKVYNSPSTGG